jgi:hypothetical protein
MMLKPPGRKPSILDLIEFPYGEYNFAIKVWLYSALLLILFIGMYQIVLRVLLLHTYNTYMYIYNNKNPDSINKGAESHLDVLLQTTRIRCHKHRMSMHSHNPAKFLSLRSAPESPFSAAA